MKKKIGIIGAGITGLALGNLLKKNNINFTIYEKNDEINLGEGFGIQLSINGIKILNKIGFDKFDKNQKSIPNKLDFFSILNGNKICDLHISYFNSEEEQYSCLKRSSLIKFLKENLFSNSIQFGKKVSTINDSNSKVEIKFQDNSSDNVDYLVVCDGIFSPTRTILDNNFPKAKYSGSIAIRSAIKGNLNNKNISVFIGPNLHLVTYPINNQNDLSVIAVIKKKMNKEDLENHKEIIDQNFILKTLNTSVLKNNDKLIKLFDSKLSCWPIFISQRYFKPKADNILFLGDAFFAFLPTLAQGASQGIESAYEFSEMFNKNEIIKSEDFYKIRIKRSNLINKRSQTNYFVFHLANPFLVFLRNFTLKILVQNKKFLNVYLGNVFRN